MKSFPSLMAVGTFLLVTAGALQAQSITLFEDNYYRGQRITVDRAMADLGDWRWNDKASSLKIESGEWEVCRDANFRGCVRVDILAVPDLGKHLRMNDSITSLRPINSGGHGPGPGHGQGQSHDRGFSASAQGHGVHLSDADPLMVSSVQAEMRGNGTFVLNTSGEGSIRIEGTWNSGDQGVMQVQIQRFNGSPASGNGRLEVNGDRLNRVIIDGGGFRISFTAGKGGATKIAGNSVTCESYAGGLTFCPVNPGGAVRIERRLGGSTCTYNQSWSWHRDGIWVDAGCRGEFTVGQGGGAGPRR